MKIQICSLTHSFTLTQAPLGSAQSLPLQQKQRPPVTPEPALPAHAVQSRPETDTETCGSPDVRAAAEALLQAQLQEIGIPSDQIHPQLLNLISALAGVSSGTSSTVSANTDPRASPHEPIVVTQQSGRAASEPVQEIAKVPKLSRHDSVRRQRGSVVCQDGSECMHGGPLEGAPVTRGNVTDFEQKQSHHERQHHQHDGQLQAAAYAQQLYALLVQAQCPQVSPAHSLLFFVFAEQRCCLYSAFLLYFLCSVHAPSSASTLLWGTHQSDCQLNVSSGQNAYHVTCGYHL